MDWELLIPLLMFAFPVVVALLDKRAKQKRAAAPPTQRPTAPSYNRIPGQARNEVPFTRTDRMADSVIPEKEKVIEGERAIHRKEEEKKEVEKHPADKLKIDKKKLIIYSEILKPKFDE